MYIRASVCMTIETTRSNSDPIVVDFVKNTSIDADYNHAIPDAFLFTSFRTSRSQVLIKTRENDPGLTIRVVFDYRNDPFKFRSNDCRFCQKYFDQC